MGNSIDCCYATRQYNQCFFPCIRSCSYTTRRVWYNYDGLETVQPLIDIIKPEKGVIRKFPKSLADINTDREIASKLAIGLDTPGQLAAICRFASNYGYRVRAVGTGSSWSRLTSTRDILIDMTNLNRILTPKPANRKDNLKQEFVDIEVEGGMQVHRFVEKLDKVYGLALPMMGNYAGQTVAGVACTSTHGSGYFTGTMSTSVVGFHLIISTGIQVRLSHGEETFDQCQEKIKHAQFGGAPVELKSTEVFRAVAVSLGSMGIIYSITYRCISVYKIEEERTEVKIPWPGKEKFRVKQKFEPMFTNRAEGEFFSFFVNPYPAHKRFLYAAYLKGKRTTRRSTCCACCSWWCCKGGRGCADVECVQTDCIASCLQTCASCCPTRIPDITNCGVSQFSREHSYVQKWYNVLQFTKGNMHVRTAEFCLPLSQLDEALGDVIETANQYADKFSQYSLLPIYVRIVKTDDLYLSPANERCPQGGQHDHACYIEVPFLPGAFGIEEYHKTIEDKLFYKYKARPHWSKNNHLTTGRVIELYPELEQWKKVFRMFNSTGIFCNEFTHNMGFDTCIADLVRPRNAPGIGIENDGLEIEDVITVEPVN